MPASAHRPAKLIRTGSRTSWRMTRLDGGPVRSVRIRPAPTWLYLECEIGCGQNRLMVFATLKDAVGRQFAVTVFTWIRLTVRCLPARRSWVAAIAGSNGNTMTWGGWHEKAHLVSNGVPVATPLDNLQLRPDRTADSDQPPFTFSTADNLDRLLWPPHYCHRSARQALHSYGGGRGRLTRSADDDGYYQRSTSTHSEIRSGCTDSASRVLQTATFNVRGLRQTCTDADLGPWQFAYNAFGEPTSYTDANGKTTLHLGRPRPAAHAGRCPRVPARLLEAGYGEPVPRQEKSTG